MCAKAKFSKIWIQLRLNEGITKGEFVGYMAVIFSHLRLILFLQLGFLMPTKVKA